ncbi:hypothetical protein [Streptomyces sp. ITFR-16]|uniref:hypothetical protein n=1 Tax=Streptomyces sp. ITFR-16 TaxID=3075198 RepID=UPI002889CC4F|nr:hypothetical protein [Streptomyces sp. ITFR-16]WNI27115.1 hypothetical protein RLT58_31790 [Streptomyces sp. ITFR-16]
MFVCERCGSALTAPVSEVGLPLHARHAYGHAMMPPLMESGTYAVDPEPSGLPWRRWDVIAAEDAEARGVFAPLHGLSFGPPGAVVVAPGDTRGTVLIPGRCAGYCMGLDGRDGPNLARAHCGREVATRIDDCSYWQTVWFEPQAVRVLAVPGPEFAADDWETLVRERAATPPIEDAGRWSPLWEAEAGAALAHLVAASEGARVEVAEDLVAAPLGRAADALLPQGPGRRVLGLRGPGLPAPARVPDIALVPRHPRTGEVRQPPETADVVPIAAGVWLHLAFPRERLPVPATGGLPRGVLRDDPLPPHPWGALRPDLHLFLHTPARLPAVRRPWLRELYDRVRAAG